MTETSRKTLPQPSNAAAEHEAQLNRAADEIRSTYQQFVQRVEPSLTLYAALGRRAQNIRKENEKLPR